MANNYLLLRGNKQTGPYSVADLRELGLKAYDLVWLQGKSAAWRYPSEIDELKELAAVVEEQPFDRFFKKNAEEKKEMEPVQQQQEYMPKPSVFMTMPKQKRFVSVTEMAEQPSTESKTIIVKENPIAAQARLVEPVDEIKEMYTRSFQQRKQKISRKNSLVKKLKKASVFLYMIALGVMIGLTFKISTAKKDIATTQQANTSQSIDQIPVQNTPITKQEDKTETSPKTDETIKQSLPVEKSTVQKQEEQPEKRNAILSKKENTQQAKTEIDPNQVSPGVEINSSTGERTKKNRTGDNSDQSETSKPKDDASKLVQVKGSDYKRGAFGGIRDLQLTVTNGSKYVLDNVTVELQYLKPSEEPLKSQNIEFKSIAPNGSLTIVVPPTNRGIKVTYRIIKIESKEMDNSTAGL